VLLDGRKEPTMKSLRVAVVAAAFLLAGAARAGTLTSGYVNQEEARAAAEFARTTPVHPQLTAGIATLTSGYVNQEEARASAARVHTTPPYVDLTACPPSHEQAHERIAQLALQVPDRDRGKIIANTNCCDLQDHVASATVHPGDHR
jgi:hypothetical protein